MVRRGYGERRCVERQNAGYPEEWCWGDPLINSPWAYGRKALVGQSFALLPDVIKPVLDLLLEVGRLRFLYYNSGF